MSWPTFPARAGGKLDTEKRTGEKWAEINADRRHDSVFGTVVAMAGAGRTAAVAHRHAGR
jgi:hypothetical protein